MLSPRRVLTVGLVTAAVATSVSVTAIAVTRSGDARAAADTEQQYLQAARQGVLNLTTISADTVDADVERVASSATGAFRDEFTSRANDVASVVRDADVTATGSITEAGLESMTDTSAQVLVAATSTITNSAGAQNEPRNWRLRVSLERDGDRIAVSDVEFVP